MFESREGLIFYCNDVEVLYNESICGFVPRLSVEAFRIKKIEAEVHTT